MTATAWTGKRAGARWLRSFLHLLNYSLQMFSAHGKPREIQHVLRRSYGCTIKVFLFATFFPPFNWHLRYLSTCKLVQHFLFLLCFRADRSVEADANENFIKHFAQLISTVCEQVKPRNRIQNVSLVLLLLPVLARNCTEPLGQPNHLHRWKQ